MNNIIEHPRRKRRIAQAKAKIFESFCQGGRGDGSSVSQRDFDELITTAVVHELEVPGSGVAALKSLLHQWGQHPDRIDAARVEDGGPIKIGKRG